MDLLDTLKRNELIKPESILNLSEFLSAMEPSVKSTVEENLCLMYSTEKGGMARLDESLASTGGYIDYESRKIPCCTANFHYDPNSGKILYFENIQHIPAEIKEIGCQGHFHVAIDNKNFRQFVNEAKVGKSNPLVSKVINLTVQAYNKTFGY